MCRSPSRQAVNIRAGTHWKNLCFDFRCKCSPAGAAWSRPLIAWPFTVWFNLAERTACGPLTSPREPRRTGYRTAFLFNLHSSLFCQLPRFLITLRHEAKLPDRHAITNLHGAGLHWLTLVVPLVRVLKCLFCRRILQTQILRLQEQLTSPI